MPRIGLFLIGGGLTVAAIYGACLVALVTMQTSLQYPAGGEVVEPSKIGLANVEPVSIETPDGETLLAWYQPALAGNSTILFLHGNGGTLSNRAFAFQTILDAGYGLLAVSYRGYAGSTGKPSQDGLTTDALASFDWLAERTDRIVIYGQSLGSGVATQLALRRDALALVLEVPFASAVDVAAHRYPVFPVRLLMRDQWKSVDVIGDIGEPVLVLEAENERVIPSGHAKRLFDAATDPKEYVLLEGAGHNSAWRHGLIDHLSEFVTNAEEWDL